MYGRSDRDRSHRWRQTREGAEGELRTQLMGARDGGIDRERGSEGARETDSKARTRETEGYTETDRVRERGTARRIDRQSDRREADKDSGAEMNGTQ